MSSPPNLWLAREGQVHGPYDLGQLMEMEQQGQLLPGDSFCPEGEHHWMTYEEWRATLPPPPPVKPKQTIIRPKAANADDAKRKTRKFKLKPPPHLASLPKARVPSRSPDPEAQAHAQTQMDPKRRLFRMVEAISDHRRAHPQRHPFYFIEPHHFPEVISWLDQHHPGWDIPPAVGTYDGSPKDIVHEWFIPALAMVKPDLVKPSHRADFGDGRPWRSLDESVPGAL